MGSIVVVKRGTQEAQLRGFGVRDWALTISCWRRSGSTAPDTKQQRAPECSAPGRAVVTSGDLIVPAKVVLELTEVNAASPAGRRTAVLLVLLIICKATGQSRE